MPRKFSLGFLVVGVSILAIMCLGHAALGASIPFTTGTFTLNGNDVQGSSRLPPAEPATPAISGGVLTLTQDDNNPSGAPYFGPGQASSAIYNTISPINTFTAQFTYQFSNPTADPRPADGATFVIENDPAGTSALGGTGGGLGYGFASSGIINNSVAVELNLYDGYNAGPPNIGGTALGQDGAAPTHPFPATSNGTAGTTVNLLSGDPITVLLTYDGSNLTETLTDATAGTTFTTTYTGLNIPSIVGSSNGPGMAYIGFTGGYGADTSTQTISNFSFTGTSAVPLPRGASTGLALLAAMGLFALARRRMAQPA